MTVTKILKDGSDVFQDMIYCTTFPDLCQINCVTGCNVEFPKNRTPGSLRYNQESQSENCAKSRKGVKNKKDGR